MKSIDMESSLQFPESETEVDYAGKVAETPLLYSYKLMLGGLLFDERICLDEEFGTRFSGTDEPKCIGRSRLLAHGSPCVGCAGTADAAACCPFWVTEKKTGKRRMVGLPAALLEEIRKGAGDVWAFPGRDPRKHRTRQAVWKDIKRSATAFRLRENLTPHSLRKVYAVELLERYGDFDKVRRNLNHAYDSTTSLYAMADVLTKKGLTRRKGRGKLKGSKTPVHRKGQSRQVGGFLQLNKATFCSVACRGLGDEMREGRLA